MRTNMSHSVAFTLGDESRITAIARKVSARLVLALVVAVLSILGLCLTCLKIHGPTALMKAEPITYSVQTDAKVFTTRDGGTATRLGKWAIPVTAGMTNGQSVVVNARYFGVKFGDNPENQHVTGVDFNVKPR